MSADVPTTFLDLCQRTASECGVSLTGPSAVAGQTGRLGQIVGWVQQAWGDIQTLHDDWFFMRSSFRVDTTASLGDYAYTACTDTNTGAAITSFRRWCGDAGEALEVRMKAYLVSAGVATQTDLTFKDFREFTEIYLVGSPTPSYPQHWSRSPAGHLLLGPAPDAIYRVSGDYLQAASAMSGDTGTPSLPAEYRMAIVYRAMMKYGRYDAASETYSDGQDNYRRMLAEMRRTQRPTELVGGELA